MLPRAIASGHNQEHTAFRALALGAEVPRTLAGKIPAIAISNVNTFSVAGRGADAVAGGKRV